jgi:hypothetical protein
MKMDQAADFPRFRWYVLLIMAVATVAQGILRIALATLIGVIAKTLDLNRGEIIGVIMGL